MWELPSTIEKGETYRGGAHRLVREWRSARPRARIRFQVCDTPATASSLSHPIACLPQRRGFGNRYSLTRHCLLQRDILGQWTAAVCCFQCSLAAPHSGAETGDHRGCPIAGARVRAPNCQREVSPSTCLARSCLRHDEHGSAVVVAARAPPSTAGTDRTETGHVARTGPSGA
jgi:hypothetical protein